MEEKTTYFFQRRKKSSYILKDVIFLQNLGKERKNLILSDEAVVEEKYLIKETCIKSRKTNLHLRKHFFTVRYVRDVLKLIPEIN